MPSAQGDLTGLANLVFPCEGGQIGIYQVQFKVR